jgi:PTH1 family peptidyl-tRNA hydrolase
MSFLLLAIGNPGDYYKNARHNLGTLVLWQLIKLYDEKFEPSPKDYQLIYKNKTFFCKWTISYVNTTGSPMALFMNKNKIQPSQLMVFFDNMELETGQWKYSYGFGTYGHNGLKSIKHFLMDQPYHRIGCGIGRPKNNDVSDYVLGNLSLEEQKYIYLMAYDLFKNNILDKLIESNINDD